MKTADSERAKIIHDMQYKINDSIEEASKWQVKEQDMFSNWEDYLNSDTKSDNTIN